MFTKQHFIALAKLIKESDAQNKYELAQDLAKLFKFFHQDDFSYLKITVGKTVELTKKRFMSYGNLESVLVYMMLKWKM